MGEVLDIAAVVRDLREWAGKLRLTERAVAAWEREYADHLARPITGPGMPRSIAAAVISHGLEFALPTESIIPPRVIPRLQLTVGEGHCEVGTFELVTDLDGVSRFINLDLTPLSDEDRTAPAGDQSGIPF